MKNRILLRTNLLICIVVVVSFLLGFLIVWDRYNTSSMRYVETVSYLTSENFDYQISEALSKPIKISKIIANDILLKEFLVQETVRENEPDYQATLSKYLENYKRITQYDIVFFASAATGRFYSTNNLDQHLSPEDPESAWYYEAISLPDEYTLCINNDLFDGVHNILTLFVDCKIYNGDQLLGLIGVGMRIKDLQYMINSYKETLGVNAYFVDSEGVVQLSSNYSGFEKVHIKDIVDYSDNIEQAILDSNSTEKATAVWTVSNMKKTNIVVRDIPDIGWKLIVEKDNSETIKSIMRQFGIDSVLALVIIAVVMWIVAKTIHKLTQQIVSMEQAYEQERKTMFERATEQLFEDIYVMDITHNRPANKVTVDYFARLGAPAGTPLDKCLRIVADKQIKEEFRQGYLNTFSPTHVLDAFVRGQNTLKYEFMMTDNGTEYHWMRITACLMESDREGGLLIMLSYRQNIDKEKEKEDTLKERARIDAITGLLHKTATQNAIDEILELQSQLQDQTGLESLYALYIFDIDNFKEANDTFGHAFGDKVITQVAHLIRSKFRSSDLVGRIGGDEFAAFLRIPDTEWAKTRAAQINQAMNKDFVDGDMRWHMSISIGVAFSPRHGRTFKELYDSADAALYNTKRNGRDGFSLACSDADGEIEK